jgi:prepilin-type N-terminal cleavage/methylation domain-containing protein
LKLIGKKTGFSLIELLIVLLVISTIMIFAVEEYRRYIEDAKLSRAKADMDELVKAVRLYNIREGHNFQVATFSLPELGNFVGTYLEKEPSKDPWGNFYLHSPEMGAVISKGPNGKAESLDEVASGPSDDIIARYLPENFFIAAAEYVDANLNNVVDFGDYLELRFSRPAKLNNPVVVDFETQTPQEALGSALINKTDDPFIARVDFVPPVAPDIKLGQTKIYPREYIDSIVDKSPKQKKLKRLKGVVIKKKNK